ncbi:MAG: serine protease [Terriglobia bacterium]|nr:serine protease [Terriglobia bacterium]
MNINDWVVKTELAHPVTEHALLLLGRDEETVHPLGTAVFVSPGLAITAKHVIEESWRMYGHLDVPMERRGGQTAHYEILAVQYPGSRSDAAMWIVRRVWASPYSDLAAVSLEPADNLSKSYVFTKTPVLRVLPPDMGESVTAFGYASSSVITLEGNQLNLSLNPLTALGTVTEVYPERRDRGMLSFPSFQVQGHFIGGMSGGPIYNSIGEICGLVCSGDNDAPNANGVVLWPILVVMISHQGFGVTCTREYRMSELAHHGRLSLKDFDKVANHVELVDEPLGKGWLRLKSSTP